MTAQILLIAVLIVHLMFVLFLVAGLLLIVWGALAQWDWVRNIWFRLAHLLGIGFVVAESWLGLRCPLTILEKYLRTRTGDEMYSESFIAHWLDELLYVAIPEWILTIVYTVFGAIVLLTFILYPPHRKSRVE